MIWNPTQCNSNTQCQQTLTITFRLSFDWWSLLLDFPTSRLDSKSECRTLLRYSSSFLNHGPLPFQFPHRQSIHLFHSHWCDSRKKKQEPRDLIPDFRTKCLCPWWVAQKQQEPHMKQLPKIQITVVLTWRRHSETDHHNSQPFVSCMWFGAWQSEREGWAKACLCPASPS